MSKVVKKVVSAVKKIIKVIAKAVKFVVNAVKGFVKKLASGDITAWIMVVAIIVASPLVLGYLTPMQSIAMGALSILATEFQTVQAEKLQAEAEKDLKRQEQEALANAERETDIYFEQMEEGRYDSYSSNTFGMEPVLTSGESWIEITDATHDSVYSSETPFNMSFIGAGIIATLFLFGDDNEQSVQES